MLPVLSQTPSSGPISSAICCWQENITIVIRLKNIVFFIFNKLWLSIKHTQFTCAFQVNKVPELNEEDMPELK